jgi:malonate-semialdehyde dehydrogenase (acetylating)/methylmalonate-semialdehyde dehydrogenase
MKNGALWDTREMTEIACNVTNNLMGEVLMNTSTDYDTTLYREPLGVFAGIAP